MNDETSKTFRQVSSRMITEYMKTVERFADSVHGGHNKIDLSEGLTSLTTNREINFWELTLEIAHKESPDPQQFAKNATALLSILIEKQKGELHNPTLKHEKKNIKYAIKRLTSLRNQYEIYSTMPNDTTQIPERTQNAQHKPPESPTKDITAILDGVKWKGRIGSKADLAELIKGLYYMKVIEKDGNPIELEDLQKNFESVFDNAGDDLTIYAKRGTLSFQYNVAKELGIIELIQNRYKDVNGKPIVAKEIGEILSDLFQHGKPEQWSKVHGQYNTGSSNDPYKSDNQKKILKDFLIKNRLKK